MTTKHPAWLVEGARVAVLTLDGNEPAAYQLRTVARLTAAQAVLDDGGRWRLKDLRPVGYSGRTGWERYSHLLAPTTDLRILTLRVSARLRSLGRVIEPWLTGKRTHTDVPGALALLDQVEQAVADTRGRITQLAPTED